jgi:hypothetical protein
MWRMDEARPLITQRAVQKMEKELPDSIVSILGELGLAEYRIAAYRYVNI